MFIVYPKYRPLWQLNAPFIVLNDSSIMPPRIPRQSPVTDYRGPRNPQMVIQHFLVPIL